MTTVLAFWLLASFAATLLWALVARSRECARLQDELEWMRNRYGYRRVDRESLPRHDR